MRVAALLSLEVHEVSVASDQRDTVPDWEPWGEDSKSFPLWPFFVLGVLVFVAWLAREPLFAEMRRLWPDAMDGRASETGQRRVLRLGEVPLSLDQAKGRSTPRRPKREPASDSGGPLSAQIAEVTAHNLDEHLDNLAPTRAEDRGLSAREGRPLGNSLAAEMGTPQRRRRNGRPARRSIDFLAATPDGPARSKRGTMAQDAARSGLSELEPAVRRCHLLQPSAKGRLSYEFEVDSSGRVIEITEGDDSTLARSRVAHCVARAIERIRLPSEPGRPIVLLEYAWDLR